MFEIKPSVYYYNIKVLDQKRNIIECLVWDHLPWKLRLKYDWYFKYRAALLQVKYPRFIVEIYHGKIEAEGKSLSNILKDKITSKKAKITEYKNKLQLAKSNWNSLFPIEDDADYQRACAKINTLENDLICLQNQKNEIDKNQ